MPLPKITVEKRLLPSQRLNIAAPVVSTLVALLISAIPIYVGGVNPLYGYGQLLYGALGDKLALTETFVMFAPLLLCGLSVALGFHVQILEYRSGGAAVFRSVVRVILCSICDLYPIFHRHPRYAGCRFLGGRGLGHNPRNSESETEG